MINENGLLNIFPTAEASGSIVSFENGADGIPMESLSVAVEPTQDLHGYSSPWPGGGGKNLLNPATMAPGYLESSGNVHAQGDQKEYYSTEYYEVGSQTAISVGYNAFASTESKWIAINWYDANKTNLSRATNSASISTFTPASGAVYFRVSMRTYDHGVENCYCALGSDITFAPYCNICPISGRTGLSVYRTGVNVWDEVWELGGIDGSGNNQSGTDRIRSKNYIPVTPGATYYYYINSTYGIYAWGYDSSKTYVGRVPSNGWAISNNTVTIPSGVYYIRIVVQPGYGTTYNNDISINYPSTDTGYHAYAGNTYAADWTSEAGTVYHGTVDPVTGLLTVDRIGITPNVKSLQSINAYGIANFLFSFPQNALNTQIAKENAISNVLKTQTSSIASTTEQGIMIANDFNGYVRLDSAVASTKEQANTWISDNGLLFVYELATPITYQLTPQEVATLLGANRVWSDAGDISLVYHTQVDATPSSIDGLFINGEGLQDDGWFLKWRKLAAPKPKTDYVSVWGRDGDIDLTESETDGQVFYENRELTMDMVYIGEDWTDAYSELLDMLHGKECAVQFSNDPYWYWAGRIIASLYEHKPHSLTMSGIMFPYKLSVAKVTRSATVSGAIESNGVDVVLPSSRMRVSPKVTVVAGTGESVTLKWGTKTQTLSAGTYYVRGLKVGSDDVTIKVWGTGTVIFEYRKGML